MKRFILSILIATLILTLIGCRQANDKKRSKEVTAVETSKITTKDIEDAKQVINKYFTSLKNKDIVEINKTLGRYKKDLYTKDNIDKWMPELISINYPGKYTNDNIPPKSYISNYGTEPYKSMNLNVIYKVGNEHKNWDYILIKETKESPWEIHDWGY